MALQTRHCCGAVAVDQDGEDDGLSAGGGQVAREGVGLVVRAGFGPEMAAQGGVVEAVGEGAVDAGDGQRGAQDRTPGLARGVDQQLREGRGERCGRRRSCRSRHRRRSRCRPHQR